MTTPEGARIVTSPRRRDHHADRRGRRSAPAWRCRTAPPSAWRTGRRSPSGDLLFAWDPYSEPIVADFGGVVRFIDIVEEETVREELDESTGRRQMVIIEDRSKKLHPMIEIRDPETDQRLREFIVPGGRAAHGARRRADRAGRHAGEDRPRGVQDPRHHRRSAAHRRAVRGAQAQGPGGDHGDRRHRPLRRHQARQARGDRHPRHGERADLRGPGRQAPPRARGRLRARRRPPVARAR